MATILLPTLPPLTTIIEALCADDNEDDRVYKRHKRDKAKDKRMEEGVTWRKLKTEKIRTGFGCLLYMQIQRTRCTRDQVVTLAILPVLSRSQGEVYQNTQRRGPVLPYNPILHIPKNLFNILPSAREVERVGNGTVESEKPFRRRIDGRMHEQGPCR